MTNFKKKKQQTNTKSKGNCLLYLFNKYSKSLILERFWEFNPFSSFVIDCQSSDNEVCVAIDHFSHHAIPAFRICSINLLIYRTFKSGVISELLGWMYKILLTHREPGLPGSAIIIPKIEERCATNKRTAAWQIIISVSWKMLKIQLWNSF